MKLAVQALCHKGLVRDRNEDALSVGGRVLRDASTEITTDISDRGFFFLLVADTLARTIAAPAELPVGSITALAGAPYFIYLVLRKRG